MNILIIGNLYLTDALKKKNTVVTAGIDNNYDIVVDSFFCDVFEDIIKKLPGAFYPDVIILFEGPQQIFPQRLEELDIPLAWHAMDSHVNYEWHKDYAVLFDYIFVCEKDYIPILSSKSNAKVLFTPLTCDPDINRPLFLPKKYDMVFVGSVHDDYYGRKEYLSFFQKHFNLKLFSNYFAADMNKIFNEAKIVLNHPIKNDLNFRVFEAMASGSMLLTSRINNGMDDFFVSGTDYISFDSKKLEEGVDKAVFYLAHDRERERIALSGCQKVRKAHTRLIRAEQIVEFIMENPVKKNISDNLYKSLGNAYFILEQLVFSLNKTRRYAGEAWHSSSFVLQKHIEMYPNDPEGYYLLGMCMIAREDFVMARSLFCKCLEVDHSYFRADIGLGALALNENRIEDALLHIGKALNDNYSEAKAVLEKTYLALVDLFAGFFTLGGIFFNLGFVSESIVYFERALDLDAQHNDLLKYLGVAYFKEGREEEALTCFKRVLTFDSKDKMAKQFIFRISCGAG